MRNAKYTVAGTAVLAVSLSAHASGTLFSGSIQYNLVTGPIVATANWNNSNTKLSWNISQVAGAFPWQYSYTWETGGKDLSHINIEASANTVGTDFNFISGPVTLENDNPKTHTGPGNPNLPEPLFGLKFTPNGDLQDVTWTFTSTRSPTWGDFYAKDGKVDGVDVTAWNAGLTASDTDPSVDWAAFALGDQITFQHDGAIRSLHIAVPDTVEIPIPIIPEPSTYAAIGGLAATFGAHGWSRMRRARHAARAA